MKNDFIVSKTEAPTDGSQYVLVTFTDKNESTYTDKSGEAIPFTSPEVPMKDLPRAISNMFGTGGGTHGNSPTFKIEVREYENMSIKVRIELD